MSLLRRPGEKTYTQRCRLFVGNLPADITEEEFKRLFAKYGEPGEVFINKGKGFGFIKLVSNTSVTHCCEDVIATQYCFRVGKVKVKICIPGVFLSTGIPGSG